MRTKTVQVQLYPSSSSDCKAYPDIHIVSNPLYPHRLYHPLRTGLRRRYRDRVQDARRIYGLRAHRVRRGGERGLRMRLGG